MKTIALIILLFASPAWADGLVIVESTCADTSCTGFDICQNFETATTGYDNGESWTEAGGTIDPVDTTPTVGRGSQQVSVVWDTSTGRLQKTFTARSEVSGHFIYKTADATPASTKSVAVIDDGTTSQLKINMATDGRLAVTDDSSTAYTVNAMSDNTLYRVWYHYLKGTGSDAVLSVGFVAVADRTPVTAGDGFASMSNGDSTLDVSRLQLLENLGDTAYFDQVLQKQTTIGTVCQ